jgi:hypothetical protein
MSMFLVIPAQAGIQSFSVIPAAKPSECWVAIFLSFPLFCYTGSEARRMLGGNLSSTLNLERRTLNLFFSLHQPLTTIHHLMRLADIETR